MSSGLIVPNGRDNGGKDETISRVIFEFESPGSVDIKRFEFEGRVTIGQLMFLAAWLEDHARALAQQRREQQALDEMQRAQLVAQLGKVKPQ